MMLTMSTVSPVALRDGSHRALALVILLVAFAFPARPAPAAPTVPETVTWEEGIE